MGPQIFSTPPRRPGRRGHRRLLFLPGLVLLAPGCAHWGDGARLPAAAVADSRVTRASSAYAAVPGPDVATDPAVRQASAQVAADAPVETLPTPKPAPQAGAPAPWSTPATPANHLLPISLDTVLRLAEEQNPQVALARERVRQAYADKDVAGKRWLPDLWLGTAYYRHEGGIQNEDGTLIHSSTGALFAGMEMDGRLDVREVAYQRVNAQRQVWQQRGELSRVTSETLLDAANTYIDLLAARTGEAIARDMQKTLRALLDRAERLAAQEPAARVEVLRVRAEVDAEEQSILKLRNQAQAASAKLDYLLGLDPCTELVPVDQRLVAFELVDASAPTCDLVTRALASGPGVREMEGLLALIQQSLEKAQGPGKYLPVFEMRMAEGAFGAGPGDDATWDNRWDLALQARWNLTELATARDRMRAAQSKIQQAHLSYQDLRAKLTAGVQEAQGTILSGRDQFRAVEAHIRDARGAYDLADRRLLQNATGASYSENLLALNSVGRAQANYVSVLSAYDKAQIRLMVLLGPGACLPATADARP